MSSALDFKLINDISFSKDFLIYISVFFKNIFELDNEYGITLYDQGIDDLLKILKIYQDNIDKTHDLVLNMNKYDLYFGPYLTSKNTRMFNTITSGFWSFHNRLLRLAEIDKIERENRLKIKTYVFNDSSLSKESSLLSYLNHKNCIGYNRHDFIQKISVLAHKYSITFLTEECELLLCDTRHFCSNIIEDILWAFQYKFYNYIENLIWQDNVSSHPIYTTLKLLDKDPAIFKKIFDLFVLGKIKEDDGIIIRDWCKIPDEYKKHPNYENVYIYSEENSKYFEVKNDNIFSWLEIG